MPGLSRGIGNRSSSGVSAGPTATASTGPPSRPVSRGVVPAGTGGLAVGGTQVGPQPEQRDPGLGGSSHQFAVVDSAAFVPAPRAHSSLGVRGHGGHVPATSSAAPPHHSPPPGIANAAGSTGHGSGVTPMLVVGSHAAPNPLGHFVTHDVTDVTEEQRRLLAQLQELKELQARAQQSFQSNVDHRRKTAPQPSLPAQAQGYPSDSTGFIRAIVAHQHPGTPAVAGTGPVSLRPASRQRRH